MHILIALLTALAVHASPLHLLIDPGHGGRDRGTEKGEMAEAVITLAVAQELKTLMAHDKRFRVELTRDDDSKLSLYQRARIAKDKRADLFVSIHVNSSPDSKAKGAEFYFQNQLPPDEESKFLAHQEDVAEAGEKVQPITYSYLDENEYPQDVHSILNDLLDGERVLRSSELSRALKVEWHGSKKSKANSVRQAPFYVLLQMRIPSTLVELGFLTNTEDYRALTSQSARRKMAEDIYHGLVRYKESMDKVSLNP